jgi:hypothetical protein
MIAAKRGAVGRAKDRDGEIEIFTPAELSEILSHAKEEIMSFLVVGGFAGVRRIEIQRLVWEDIRLEDGLIEIRAKNAKTASRSVIPVVLNLKEWLLKNREDTGPVCDYSNVGFALHKLTKAINEARRAVWAKKHGKTGGQAAAGGFDISGAGWVVEVALVLSEAMDRRLEADRQRSDFGELAQRALVAARNGAVSLHLVRHWTPVTILTYGMLSISSARAEMEFVPEVSFRMAPPVATSLPVSWSYSV